MFESLQKRMPSDVSWIRPDGGFYYWLSLPQDKDATEILTKSLKNGAVFVTGKTFDPHGKINNKIRLSFSNMKHQEIDKGIQIIANAIEGKG